MAINHGFWSTLKRPFYALAPMADVTDAVFRRVIAEIAKPDVFFTEFVSADGLMHPDAREKLLVDLKYSEIERPIVGQIFSSKPEKIFRASKLVAELGFDGIDINMGCPDRKVEKQDAGAALIKKENHGLVKELIAAAKEGSGLPVSVKSRLGYSNLDELDEWMGVLLNSGLSAITMHLRTRKEMSKVPAHWELGGKLRNLASRAPSGARDAKLVANGDVEDLDDAKVKVNENNLDGVMLGRAVFGNPWLFSGKKKEDIPWEERFRVLLRHTKLFEETYSPVAVEPPRGGSTATVARKPFHIMRKFFGAYVAGHKNAKKLKAELMQCESYREIEKVISDYK